MNEIIVLLNSLDEKDVRLGTELANNYYSKKLDEIRSKLDPVPTWYYLGTSKWVYSNVEEGKVYHIHFAIYL